MKHKKQPFFVKRIRLKRSVAKTNQILEIISNFDRDSKQYASLGDHTKQESIEFLNKTKRTNFNPVTKVNQTDLYCHYSKLNLNNIREIVKNHKEKKDCQTQQVMGKIGLQVRRIFGDPKHKRSYHYSSDDYKESKKNDKNSMRAFNLTVNGRLTLDPNQLNNNEGQFVSFRKTSKNMLKCSTMATPHNKNRKYLYQKMANSENSTNMCQNHIYDKRIKSYTYFLWKCLLAHNVYTDLNLRQPTPSFKKLKAFVGFGNNCNMIKGLIKRRFWWSLSEELTNDCTFIWTQIKINKIYQRQQLACQNKPQYKQDIQNDDSNVRMVLSSSLDKRTKKGNNLMKNIINEEIDYIYRFNQKIWNQQDLKYLQKIIKKQLTKRKKIEKQDETNYKGINYLLKSQQINKTIKQIKFIENISELNYSYQDHNNNENNYYKCKPIIHNHLPNNFYLGNKKALFYNLREYYNKIHKNVFNYIPLTFHIRQGFKDPQYHRFIKFYEERAQMIKQQHTSQKITKTRNIWIVKPGQNSNQGKGITVIDELYELNHIIKQSQQQEKPSKKGSVKSSSQQKTFIVQMYIDRPFLFNQRKFDIRHYMLITNIYGVTRAYWYEEGYIRTSSYLFSIANFEPQIHLTNDAIQKNYPQYGRYEPYNKISYTQFQAYLNTFSERRYSFKDQILTKMKEMAKDAAKSVSDKISPQNQMHNFQIFGLDFMIDRNFTPWLIEINTNPCLDCSCPLLDRIIPYMVQQGLKLSLDLVYPPPSHYPNTNKHYAPFVNLQTFKYELIYDSSYDILPVNTLQKKSSMLNEIGQIEEDQQFKDDGKQIKLEDFT